jgi:hypothetical protein
VLEREQREVGEPGHVALRREDAEDATLVARPVPVVEISIHRGGLSRVPMVAVVAAHLPDCPACS